MSEPDDPGSQAEAKHNLSPDQVEELKTAFAEFDDDQSGSIDLVELGTLLDNLGLGKEDDELKVSHSSLGSCVTYLFVWTIGVCVCVCVCVCVRACLTWVHAGVSCLNHTVAHTSKRRR